MSNAQNLEVTTLAPKEVPAFLKQREENITFYAEQLQSSEQISDGWRFLIGCEIWATKQKLDHGAFMPWVAKTYEALGDRTAQRYLQFADVVIPKFAKLANLKALPEKIQTGESLENEREAIFAAIHKLTDGRGITRYLKEEKERAHPNLCPHCSEPVSATAAVCPHCKKEVEPKHSAKDKADAERKRDNDFVDQLLGNIETLVNSTKLPTNISAVKRDILLAAFARGGDFLRGKLNTKQVTGLTKLIGDGRGDTSDLNRKEVKQRIALLKGGKGK